MKTARQELIKYNKKHGLGVDDCDLKDSLGLKGRVVARYGRDQHRWYIQETVVKDFDGIFIRYTDYVITGDSSMDDLCLEYNIDAAEVVERRERQVTEVYFVSVAEES